MTRLLFVSALSNCVDRTARGRLPNMGFPHLKVPRKLLTAPFPTPGLKAMDVPLNSDLQAKLSRLATAQGRPAQALVVEAIEHLVNYDEWFLREAEAGLAATDRGELVDHAEVRKMIDQRYPG